MEGVILFGCVVLKDVIGVGCGEIFLEFFFFEIG